MVCGVRYVVCDARVLCGLVSSHLLSTAHLSSPISCLVCAVRRVMFVFVWCEVCVVYCLLSRLRCVV